MLLESARTASKPIGKSKVLKVHLMLTKVASRFSRRSNALSPCPRIFDAATSNGSYWAGGLKLVVKVEYAWNVS